MSLKRILENAEIGLPTKHWREAQERSFITPVNLGVDGQKSVSVTVALRQLNRDKVKKPYTCTIDGKTLALLPRGLGSGALDLFEEPPHLTFWGSHQSGASIRKMPKGHESVKQIQLICKINIIVSLLELDVRWA